MRKILMAAAAVLIAASAQAGPFSFGCITSGVPTLCAQGEAQLTMEVIDDGGGLVSFKFSRDGVNPMSIADIYFDDEKGILSSSFSITDSGAGVAFSAPATPGDLPGGASISPAFHTTLNMSADSDPPVAPNGVNINGEWVTLTFTTLSFPGVLADLADGDLRVGLHVQAFGTEGSASFVDNPGGGPPPPPPPPPPVPEPGTLVLIGSGLLGLYSRLRA